MTLDSQEIRKLREAFASLSNRAQTSPSCPPAESIWEAVTGSLTADETADVVDHTSSCSACAVAWRLAASLASEATGARTPAPDEEVGSEAVRRSGTTETTELPPVLQPRTRFRNWFLAAAAVLLVAVGIHLLRRPDTGEPPFRRAAEGAIQSLVPEDHRLPRNGFVLRWSPGPEGSLYSVQVATPDLRVVASARGLEEAQYRVPEAALENLDSGTRLLWQVESIAPDGTRVSSRTFINQLE